MSQPTERVLRELLASAPPPAPTRRGKKGSKPSGRKGSKASGEKAPRRGKTASKTSAPRRARRRKRRPSPKQRCSFTLPSNVARAFQTLCAQQDRPPREVVEELMRSYLARHEVSRPRRQTA